MARTARVKNDSEGTAHYHLMSQTNDHPMNDPVLKSVRRSLRTNGTPAEGALWRILKGRKVGGLRFRRQFSVGRHILDFYCPALRLAIELDGDYHYHCNVPEKDYERMSELEREYGIKTLRFENKVVFENPEGIVAEVMRAAEQCVTARAPRARTPPPLRGTSPKLGEESGVSGSPSWCKRLPLLV